MAGTGKCLGTLRPVILFLYLSFCLVLFEKCEAEFQCLSSDKQPIDWFIIYKLPSMNHVDDIMFYMDNKSPVWSKSPVTMDKPSNAVYYTLQQIYKASTKSDFMYAMYNDEPPDKPTSGTRGHTKGVFGFTQKTGFWLVHSLPKFPTNRTTGYVFPVKRAKVFGQTFLCISMATDKNMNEIGKQMLYNYPDVYDYTFPDTFRSQAMADVLTKHPIHVKSPPWQRETVLQSLGGKQFHSFAKFADFDADLYGAWLAPRFKSSLLVETWQRTQASCSNCTGQYKVYNVAEVGFPQEGLSFNETKDHAKWAVTDSSTVNWSCVGDINRQQSQMHRPGGTVCLQDNEVAKSFRSIIKSYHKCGPYSDIMIQCANRLDPEETLIIRVSSGSKLFDTWIV